MPWAETFHNSEEHVVVVVQEHFLFAVLCAMLFIPNGGNQAGRHIVCEQRIRRGGVVVHKKREGGRKWRNFGGSSLFLREKNGPLCEEGF